MSEPTPGRRIKAARSTKNLSQADLARATGFKQSRLSALENDRRPCSPEEWEQLSQWLPLGSLPKSEKLILPVPRPFWRSTRVEWTTFGHCPPSVREFAAKKSFGPLAVVRGAQASQLHDPSLIARFLSEARLDSGHEFMFWTHLMAEGGAPCWFCPLKAGFDQLCIVDRESKRNLSDQRLACLDLAGKVMDWLLWPQVTLDARQGYYRLDALAKVILDGDNYWLNIEVDGEGHDSEFDHRRARHLGLLTVRLQRGEIGLTNVVEVLESRAAGLLAPRKAC